MASIGACRLWKGTRAMKTFLLNGDKFRFLNEVMANKDVYVVTMKQLVDWMKNPTPLSRVDEVKWLDHFKVHSKSLVRSSTMSNFVPSA